MKREIAEAWVKDLRTNPPQTTHKLHDEHGYCCLGRLCIVLGATFKGNSGCPTLNGETLNEYEVLPKVIMRLAGMETQSGITFDGMELSVINDSGYNFAEIADLIEENWKKL